jgi:hypothetical protein
VYGDGCYKKYFTIPLKFLLQMPIRKHTVSESGISLTLTDGFNMVAVVALVLVGLVAAMRTANSALNR